MQKQVPSFFANPPEWLGQPAIHKRHTLCHWEPQQAIEQMYYNKAS